MTAECALLALTSSLALGRGGFYRFLGLAFGGSSTTPGLRRKSWEGDGKGWEDRPWGQLILWEFAWPAPLQQQGEGRLQGQGQEQGRVDQSGQQGQKASWRPFDEQGQEQGWEQLVRQVWPF